MKVLTHDAERLTACLEMIASRLYVGNGRCLQPKRLAA